VNQNSQTILVSGWEPVKKAVTQNREEYGKKLRQKSFGRQRYKDAEEHKEGMVTDDDVPQINRKMLLGNFITLTLH
jgi:hypothetical protein